MKKNDLGFTQPLRAGAGFTLLELLIAVTIFSIAASVLYSTFYVGIKVLQRAREVMEFQQTLRLVTEEMSLDLRNSLLSPLYVERSEKLISEEEKKEKEPVYFFKGEEKRFTFVTVKDIPSADGRSKREICNVTYFLKSDGGTGLARAIQYQSRGFAIRPDEDEILLKDIEDIEIRYSFEAEDEESPPIWLNKWEEEEKVPLGIKVKIKLKQARAMREFTKTVFIPVGSLGVLEEEKI